MVRHWRGRVVGLAASVFVVWHTLAMIVAPAPESALKRALVKIMHPYLTLLGFPETWGFYTPAIAPGERLQYIVENSAGNERAFTPTEELFSWFAPRYWWITWWHQTIMDSPERYAEFYAKLLCKEHAVLDPVSITLIQLEQKEFLPSDHLTGKDPTSPEFMTPNVLKHIRCPGK
jgi:hypothetical protein